MRDLRLIKQAIRTCAMEAAPDWLPTHPVWLEIFRQAVVKRLLERAEKTEGRWQTNYRMAAAVLTELEVADNALGEDEPDPAGRATGILLKLAIAWWYRVANPLTSGERAAARLRRLCPTQCAEQCGMAQFRIMAAQVPHTDHQLGRANPKRTIANLQRICSQYCRPTLAIDTLPEPAAPAVQHALQDLRQCLEQLGKADPAAMAAVNDAYGLGPVHPTHQSLLEQMTPEARATLVARGRLMLRNCLLERS